MLEEFGRHFSFKKWLPRGISLLTFCTLKPLLFLRSVCLLFHAKGKLFEHKKSKNLERRRSTISSWGWSLQWMINGFTCCILDGIKFLTTGSWLLCLRMEKFYVNVFALVIALLFSSNLLVLTWNDESVILIAHLIDDPYCNDKFWLKSHHKKFNCTCLFAASRSAGYFMPAHSNNISLYQLHFAVFIAQISFQLLHHINEY